MNNKQKKTNIKKITSKPDIIIEYNYNPNDLFPVTVIYVRPESNNLAYENAIIKGIHQYTDIIYMANLSGFLFIKDALVLEHHSSQYHFAILGKSEIAKYPEMVKKFEDHFKIKFEKAEIIGAFDALLKLKISQEELFDTFVNDKNFLRYYGQTIKKINNYYIINYDIPALIKKYTPGINVFIIVAKFKKPDISFVSLNQSISKEIMNNSKSPIITFNSDKYKDLEWMNKVKRTYHFSHNHIMAMFDMIDFVFKKDGSHISFKETPLGNILIKNFVDENNLTKLKDYPIVYINQNNKKVLVNIIDEANGKDINQCVELIKSILW
jgi:hypothetical protein